MSHSFDSFKTYEDWNPHLNKSTLDHVSCMAHNFSSNVFRWDESSILQVSKPLTNVWFSCVVNNVTDNITKYITTVGILAHVILFCIYFSSIWMSFQVSVTPLSTSIRRNKICFLHEFKIVFLFCIKLG